jgi:integrase/recombinase XerD
MLSQDVQAYLAVRRAMGFGMKWSGNLLRGFAAFSEAAGQHHVCSETAIKWAGSPPSVRTRARRLGLVIRLARYLRAEDQRHEVPPPVFGSEDRPRRTPYIYSKEDVQRLVQAASGVGRYPNLLVNLLPAKASQRRKSLSCFSRVSSRLNGGPHEYWG